MAEAIFQHTIEYPDNHGITLSEIAATLLAQEKLIPIAVETLERIYPGLIVEQVKIKFDYAQHGSLKENLFVAILVIYQKQLDQGVPDLIEHLTGVQVPEQYRSLVSVLTVIFLYFGAKAAYEKVLGKAKDEKSSLPTISGDYNTYINIAARSLNVPPEQIERAVADTSEKRKGTIIRSAVDMFRPAKRGGAGRIMVPGLPEISREAVQEFPDGALAHDMADDIEFEPFASATLEIRAMDKDKSETGWSGKLHSGPMSTKRMKLKIGPTVDRETLWKNATVKVEALVESHRTDDDTLTPRCIHVIRVLE